MRQGDVGVTSGQRALIAFGSNIPAAGLSPQALVNKAMHDLGARLGGAAEFSRVHATPAVPAGSGPDFANAAMAVRTPFGAAELLDVLHETESAAGRVRKQRWGPRVLDIDLIALGDTVLPDAATQDAWRGLAPERQRIEAPDTLILPHPRLQERGFVLVPLAEVAPDWVHPRTGLSVKEMLQALPPADLDPIRPVG